jgi:hypothetical protein
MAYITSSVSRRLLACLAVLAVSACGESITPPTQATAPVNAQLASSTYGSTILECPIDVTSETTQTIGVLGGEIALNGHKLLIAPGVLTGDVTFKLTEPAGNYVVIDIAADGAEHYDFSEVVTLTVSYSRCTRSNIDKTDLDIYYVDAKNEIIHENIGGTDHKDERHVTVKTDHLSEYAVGGA